MDDDDATIFYLVKKGYGSVDEIEKWDTPRLLDAVEYEQIQNDIENHLYREAQRGNSSQ